MRQDQQFASSLVGSVRESYPGAYDDRSDEEIYNGLTQNPQALAATVKSVYPEYAERTDEELHAAVLKSYPQYPAADDDGDNMIELLGKGLYRGFVHTVPMRIGKVIEAYGDLQANQLNPFADDTPESVLDYANPLTLSSEAGKFILRQTGLYDTAMRNARNIGTAIKNYGALVTDYHEKARAEGWSAPDTEVEAAKWTERPFSKAAAGFGEALPEFLGAAALYVATKSPVVPSIYYGVTGGADTYVSAREAGQEIDEAKVLGLFNGAWVAHSEKVGLQNVLNMDKLAGNAAKRFAKGFAVEGVQEVIEGIGTNLIESGFDPKRAIITIDEFLGNLIVGGLLGGAVRVGMRPPSSAVEGDIDVRPDIDEGDVDVRPDVDEGDVDVRPDVDEGAEARGAAVGPLNDLDFPSASELATAINQINSLPDVAGTTQQELDALIDMYGSPGEIARSQEALRAAEAALIAEADAAAAAASQQADDIIDVALGDVGPVADGQQVLARLDAAGIDEIFASSNAPVDSTRYNEYLALIQQAFAENEVKVVTVRAGEENANAAISEFKNDSHTFSLIDERFVVDPWASQVAKITEQRVFDMHDPDDVAKLESIYGDRSGWSVDLPVRPDADESDPEPAAPAEFLQMINQAMNARRGKSKARMDQDDKRASLQNSIREAVKKRGGLDVTASDYDDYRARMGVAYKWGPKSPGTRQTAEGPKSANIHAVDVAFQEFMDNGWLDEGDTIETMLEFLVGPATPIDSWSSDKTREEDLIDQIRSENPQGLRWLEVFDASRVRTRKGLLRQAEKTVIDKILDFKRVPGETVKIQVEQLQDGDIVRMYDQLYRFQEHENFVELIDGERLRYGKDEQIVLEGVVPKNSAGYGAALDAFMRIQEMDQPLDDADLQEAPSKEDFLNALKFIDDISRTDVGREIEGMGNDVSESEVLELVDKSRQEKEDARQNGEKLPEEPEPLTDQKPIEKKVNKVLEAEQYTYAQIASIFEHGGLIRIERAPQRRGVVRDDAIRREGGGSVYLSDEPIEMRVTQFRLHEQSGTFSVSVKGLHEEDATAPRDEVPLEMFLTHKGGGVWSEGSSEFKISKIADRPKGGAEFLQSPFRPSHAVKAMRALVDNLNTQFPHRYIDDEADVVTVADGLSDWSMRPAPNRPDRLEISSRHWSTTEAPSANAQSSLRLLIDWANYNNVELQLSLTSTRARTRQERDDVESFYSKYGFTEADGEALLRLPDPVDLKPGKFTEASVQRRLDSLKQVDISPDNVLEMEQQFNVWIDEVYQAFEPGRAEIKIILDRGQRERVPVDLNGKRFVIIDEHLVVDWDNGRPVVKYDLHNEEGQENWRNEIGELDLEPFTHGFYSENQYAMRPTVGAYSVPSVEKIDPGVKAYRVGDHKVEPVSFELSSALPTQYDVGDDLQIVAAKMEGDNKKFGVRRAYVVRVVNGVRVPFYLSSGLGKKDKVEAGKWYPFFGISDRGWINKGSEQDIANYYNSEPLEKVARHLDATIGNIYNKTKYRYNRSTGKYIPPDREPKIPGYVELEENILADDAVRSWLNEGLLPREVTSKVKVKNNISRLLERIEDAERLGHTVEDKPKSVVVKEVDPKTGQQSFYGYDESGYKFEIEEVEDGAAKIKQQEDEQAAADELEKRQRSLPGMDDDVDAMPDPAAQQPGVKSVERAQQEDYEQRRISYEYFQNLPPGQKPDGEIISRRDIVNFLSDKLEITIWTGKIRMPGVLGFYRKWNQEIRSKIADNLSTITHEIGHYLHNVMFPEDTAGGPRDRGYSDFAFQFDDELKVLAVETSPWLQRDSSGNPAYFYELKNHAPGQNAKDAKTRAEGVAEFVRLYIMDPRQAQAVAPRFFAHFENELKNNAPESLTVLKQAQDMTLRYLTQTPLEHVTSMIVTGKQQKQRGTFSEWFDSFFDDLKGPRPVAKMLNRIADAEWFQTAYNDWLNENEPIKRALDSQVDEETGGLTQERADYVTQLITSYVGGWRSKVERAAKFDSIDLAGNVVGPGLKQILAQVPDHRINHFRAYLVSLRSVELHERNIQTGVLPYAAKKVVEQHAGEFEAIRKQLLAFQGQQLDLLVQSGILSVEQKRTIMKMNEYYVPMYRAFEMQGGRVSGAKAGSGYIDVRSPVYQIIGSQKQIIDPLESILRNAYVFREAAERNQIALEFVKTMELSGEHGHIMTEVSKQLKATPVRSEEIFAMLKQSGVLEDLANETDLDVNEFTEIAKERMEGMDVLGSIFRAVNSTRPAQQQFEVWENGKVRVFQIARQHQDLYRALSMMDQLQLRVLQSAKIPFARLLQAGASWVRAGSTLSFEFMARNPFRDQLQAGIYSKHGYIPFYDAFRAGLSIVKQDKLYQDWLSAGGKYSDFFAADRANMYESIQSIVGDDPTIMQFAMSIMNPKNVLSNLQEVSAIMENATKLAEFDRARRAAQKDPSLLGMFGPPSNYDIDLYAVGASKDVTLNWNKFGAKARIVNSYSAFFNAHLRDWEKLLREHKDAVDLAQKGDASRLKQIGSKAFMLVTLPSIVTWILGHDEEEIQGLPDWRKNLCWNIYIPDKVAQMSPLGQRDGFVLSIPKPFLLGQMYGTPVERALDYAFAKDPKAVGRWAKQFMVSNIPNPAEINLIIPATENFVNRSFFRKTALESYSQQRLEKRLRYHESTSEVAKFLGAKLNVSPIKIDNLVRGHFSSLGKYGLDLTDKLMITARLADVPPPPKSGVERIPVVKGFVTNPYAPQRYLGEFHETLGRAEARVSSAKAGLHENEKWFEKNKRALAFYLHYDSNGKQRITNLRNMQKRLGEITQTSRNVRSSDSLKPAQKRERLIELKRQRDDLSRSLMQNGYFHPDDIR